MAYVVKSGDSWSRIAGNLYGDQREFQRLMAANPGISVLQPGMTLRTPGKSKGSPRVTIDPNSLDRDIVDAKGSAETLRGINPYSIRGSAILAASDAAPPAVPTSGAAALSPTSAPSQLAPASGAPGGPQMPVAAELAQAGTNAGFEIGPNGELRPKRTSAPLPQRQNSTRQRQGLLLDRGGPGSVQRTPTNAPQLNLPSGAANTPAGREFLALANQRNVFGPAQAIPITPAEQNAANRVPATQLTTRQAIEARRSSGLPDEGAVARLLRQDLGLPPNATQEQVRRAMEMAMNDPFATPLNQRFVSLLDAFGFLEKVNPMPITSFPPDVSFTPVQVRRGGGGGGGGSGPRQSFGAVVSGLVNWRI